jgi:CheY-like chemotaxis protein
MCTLLISVKDTGIGISPEQQSRLFNAFTQAEASTSRKYGGTGLGLVISKSIVEMMNGQMWVESELGKGATFCFTVCLTCGKNEQKRLLSSELNLLNTRMLAVDDDPDVLTFFQETAKQIGIMCDTTKSGSEAIAMIRENGAYNIYFVDWSMPEMDGIELARKIYAQDTKDTVVIMISATDWSVIQDEAQKAGVSKFIPKPLFASSIVDYINECLSEPVMGDDDLQDDDGTSFEGRHILLAEDVEINREIVLALLEPANLLIDCAENGAEAVRMFGEAPEKYDLIFMDVQMPEMDGYDATRRIRSLGVANAQTIPIIAMTANVFKEDIEKCLAAGMNSHVGKPLDFDEVWDQLRTWLR